MAIDYYTVRVPDAYGGFFNWNGTAASAQEAAEKAAAEAYLDWIYEDRGDMENCEFEVALTHAGLVRWTFTMLVEQETTFTATMMPGPVT